MGVPEKPPIERAAFPLNQIPCETQSRGSRGTSPDRRFPGPFPKSSPRSGNRPPNPALRANPFPEVTDLFCRLPLPTLPRGLEAARLGDLMRFRVRPTERAMQRPICTSTHKFAFGALDFHGSTKASQRRFGIRSVMPTVQPYLRASRFQGCPRAPSPSAS